MSYTNDAISSADQDRLGFHGLAVELARVLTDDTLVGGHVTAIEGAWGSGKSSLLSLIGAELKASPHHHGLTIIPFQPWLIHNRDALVSALFQSLKTELSRFSGGKKAKAQEALKALGRYAKGLSRFHGLIDVAGIAFTQIPGLSKVMSFLKIAPPSLHAQKADLHTTLKDLDHRFIIQIDDLDRLDPQEALEVLRLVRSVLDLPNVIYVLCYDRDVLVHNVETALNINDGQAYLEKIIQWAVPVPVPEPNRLVRWFKTELADICGQNSQDVSGALGQMVDTESSYLKTPRRVIRVLEAIRFTWPVARDHGLHLTDFVWLQLIKVTNPDLYGWAEAYCERFAAYDLGYEVTSVDTQELIDQYMGMKNTRRDDQYLNSYSISFMFPGLSVRIKEDAIIGIDINFSDIKLGQVVAEKRLISPDHSRFYFAQSRPEHTLDHAQEQALHDALDQGGTALKTALEILYGLQATLTLTQFDFLMKRIAQSAYPQLSQTQITHLIGALANHMDQFYQYRPIEIFSTYKPWGYSVNALTVLMRARKDQNNKLHIFETGEALFWLTDVVSKQYSHHQNTTYIDHLPDHVLLTKSDLESALQVMRGRYNRLTKQDVMDCPNFLRLLFTWQKINPDGYEPAQFVQANTETDDDFLDMLDLMQDVAWDSSKGYYKRLAKPNIEPFMSYDDAFVRMQELSQQPRYQNRAAGLLKAFEAGRDENL